MTLEDGSTPYIVYYKRTAFSRSRPNDPSRDVFNSIRMDEALAKLIDASITETGVKPDEVGDVISGCALQADENWMYGGKHPALLSKLPVSVPAMAMDRACSSSLNAIAIGAMEIQTGNSDIVIAGGMEHMTHMPLGNNPHVKPNIKLLVRPEYARLDMNTGYSMGLTAEKLAKKSNISREDMDRFAVRSHKLAAESQDSFLAGEILPLDVEHDGKLVRIDKDQSIRGDTNLEQIQKLRPAFTENGRVTAGNSSPLNAGASLVMLMSERKLNEYGLKPLSKIGSMGWAGVEPSVMGEGPIPASRKALERGGFSIDDMNLWEINEAFAVVAVNTIRELGINEDLVNVHGGAIAIGHPLGATGARLAGTLSRALQEKGKDKGMATLCVGGGQGFSMVLERV